LIELIEQTRGNNKTSKEVSFLMIEIYKKIESVKKFSERQALQSDFSILLKKTKTISNLHYFATQLSWNQVDIWVKEIDYNQLRDNSFQQSFPKLYN